MGGQEELLLLSGLGRLAGEPEGFSNLLRKQRTKEAGQSLLLCVCVPSSACCISAVSLERVSTGKVIIVAYLV